ncbi:major facilitator superfamily transporter allantoate [Thozetella sp. PMI_491]|nr:major facilitator superfamily transporter allantoate [Thozetella sp. PMI_491]
MCRKIDMRLMPMLFVTYMLNFMDKQALSYSANFGLKEDNHLTGNQYSWASGSIFYLAYMVAQPVISRSLQKFPIGRFVSIMVMTWGILLMCTAASRSFGTLMAVRFLLGTVESCINPAFVVITSQWYTRDEQPARVSYWFVGNAIGQILGGVIGYGVGHIEYKDLGAWIWYFIIFGAVTFCYSIVLFVFLPDNPMNARWLSEKEKEIAVLRVLQNRTGFVNHKWKWNQFFEALFDPQTFILFALALLNTIPAGGISSYGSIVIKGFGFSSLNTTLLNVPQGAIQLVSLVSSGWFTSHFKNTRCWVMALSQIPGLIGSVLLYVLPDSNRTGKLISYYVLSTHSVSFSLLMVMLGSNYAGFTKKSTAAAIIFMGWCAGQVIAPQLFLESEAPRYPTVFLAQFICFVFLTVLPMVLQGYLMWCNWRRDKAHPIVEGESVQHHDGLLDTTDQEQKARFRYVY